MTDIPPTDLNEIAGGTTQQDLIDFVERYLRDLYSSGPRPGYYADA